MDQQQLLKDISRAYNEQALQALCARLNVDYQELEGDRESGLVRGLVRTMRHRGRLAELVRAVVQDNPDLAERYQTYLNRETDEASLIWLDELEGDQRPLTDAGLTWRWPSQNRQSQEVLRPQEVHIPIQTTTTQDLQPTLDWPDMGGQAVDQELPAADQNLQSAVVQQRPPVSTAPAESPRLHNPYTPGVPVKSLQLFFGRQAELATLRAGILDGGHTAIVGPSGIGKSSLQYALIRQGFPAERQLLLSWLDLRDSRTHTLPGLLNIIWQQWWRQIRPDISPALTNAERFPTVVAKLRAAGFQPLICLDGFEQLLQRPNEYDDSLFEAWRGLAEQQQMLLITTSQRPLADLFRRADLTTKFYALFNQLDLGLLDEPAARDLLTVPAHQRGWVIPAGATSHLLQLCGPHPLYLQIAGKYLFTRLALQSYSWAEIKEQFTQAAEPYWRALWHSLSPLAQEHFPLKSTIPTSTIAIRQSRLLARKGIVIQEGERYRPFSEGFVLWVRKETGD